MAIPKANYTQIPNLILDDLLCNLAKGELKILLTICRHTYGWQRDRQKISLGRLEKSTGLTKKSVKEGIKSLIERELIVQTEESHVRGIQYCYEINVEKDDLSIGLSETRGVVSNPLRGVENTPLFKERGVVSNPLRGVVSNPLKEKKQKEVKKSKEIQIDDLIHFHLNNDRFKSSWSDWLIACKENRKPMTPMRAKKQINMLNALTLDQAIQSIETSIANGYQGLFPPKAQSNGYRNNGHQSKTLDADQRLLENARRSVGVA